MNVQSSRLTAAMAAPASLSARLLQATTPASTTPASATGTSATGTTTTARDSVTISQAARDMLAAASAKDAPSHTVSAIGLAATHAGSGQTTQVNPYSSSSDDYQAAVRKAMDKLQTAHNNKQVSDTQFKHDMDFYTRVANAAG
ncbi:hypothetical protein [Rhodoferax sp.]|uniref:hypothetical protein n=1 Tax=Rhodoferax sp. TaxID=50421 RepID=UPI00374DF2D6